MKEGRTTLRDEPISLREAAFPGALAGLWGSILMGAAWMVFAQGGGDLWRPMKLVAATVLGEEALQAAGFQPLPVLLGLAIHFMMGLLLGIFFAWLGGYLTLGVAIGWGLIFGLAVWVIMQFGILPILNPWMAALPPISFAAVHVLFGLGLGSYPRFMPQAVEAPQALRKAA